MRFAFVRKPHHKWGGDLKAIQALEEGLNFLGKKSSIMGYYSQLGQDQYVNEKFFQNKKKGIFIDIGAYDGIHCSNTYYFEQKLHWTGICIEPNPSVFEKLKKNRKCLCIQGCISEREEKKKFLRIHGKGETLSGLIEKYDSAHLDRIMEEEILNTSRWETLLIQSYQLNDLLIKHEIDHIHFLSIDTEGGEFEILSHIRFDQFHIDVITVENNYNDPRFVPFMEKKGFRLDAILFPDLIFVNRQNNFT